MYHRQNKFFEFNRQRILPVGIGVNLLYALCRVVQCNDYILVWLIRPTAQEGVHQLAQGPNICGHVVWLALLYLGSKLAVATQELLSHEVALLYTQGKVESTEIQRESLMLAFDGN